LFSGAIFFSIPKFKVLPSTTIRQLKGLIQKKKVFTGATISNMSLALVGEVWAQI
jgi:hypothetical protein